MDFTTALETLIPLVDDVYDRWTADAKQLQESLATTHPETQVTCAKGCGACCHFPVVPATAGEAFVVLARLLAAGRTLEELALTFGTYARSYFAACTKWGGLPFTQERQKRFLSERLVCPLFTRTGDGFAGHCGVFAIRPLICDYFHSTENPLLCAEKKPHSAFTPIVERGEDAVEELRNIERSVFGRSALGHLPLLLAALCTQKGLDLFLYEHDLTEEQDADEHGQHEADFDLYVALLDAAGYSVTAADFHDLIAARAEIAARA